MPEFVFVVLHENYGDQGVDFHGVFRSLEAAEHYVLQCEPSEHERQWWEIRMVEVR